MSSAGISYREVTCDQDTELCDQLENITGQSRYPMTIIKDLTKNLDYVYFTSFDYNELGKERRIDEKVRIVPFITPETIIQKINSL